MGATYNYSLIRAVPDRRRGEWVNVGVAVYLPGEVDVRVLPHPTKLRMLAPDAAASQLAELPVLWNMLCDGITDDAMRQALLAEQPFLHASPAASFLASEQSYERMVTSIMRDLVIPPTQPRQLPKQSRLHTTLKARFRAEEILGDGPEALEKHLVVPNYPIAEGAGITADFALRNGVMRFTETLDFRVGIEQLKQSKRHQAGLKAVTLDMARRRFPDCQTSVVFAASVETLDIVLPSLTLLSDYAERVYDINNPGDWAAYLTMMKQAATGRAPPASGQQQMPLN
jgi:hypothetical protein